jgi:hypothetical protein
MMTETGMLLNITIRTPISEATTTITTGTSMVRGMVVMKASDQHTQRVSKEIKATRAATM